MLSMRHVDPVGAVVPLDVRDDARDVVCSVTRGGGATDSDGLSDRDLVWFEMLHRFEQATAVPTCRRQVQSCRSPRTSTFPRAGQV